MLPFTPWFRCDADHPNTDRPGPYEIALLQQPDEVWRWHWTGWRWRDRTDQLVLQAALKNYVWRGSSYPKDRGAVLDEVWECSNGERMLVKEMSEEHCRNALRMILRTKRMMEAHRPLASAAIRQAGGDR